MDYNELKKYTPMARPQYDWIESDMEEDPLGEWIHINQLQDFVFEMINEIQDKDYNDIGGVIGYIKIKFKHEC